MSQAKSSKAKWAITVISFIMSLIMFGAFIFSLFNAPAKTTDTIGVFGYAIGKVDDSGRIVESRESIYSKELNSVAGLEIKVEADRSIVTYQLAFYDEDKEYVSTTESYAGDFDGVIPENAEYFRIIITPNQVDDEDVKISIFNINKYAKQLTVTYNV